MEKYEIVRERNKRILEKLGPERAFESLVSFIGPDKVMSWQNKQLWDDVEDREKYPDLERTYTNIE